MNGGQPFIHLAQNAFTSLDPIIEAIRSHIISAERIHADDSVLQKHTERMIEMI
ncbi:hypothetical protein SAMN05216337_101048 [Bradyrhizobium brasilense]|uniref:Uncharacterized protein n=2 Tax=Bradyrhizobium brasilense TaxID=1419277 RepID=A0A1G6TXF8_9BRAD|nr:hypothetical protein SAMN05216337_101048 [Bradyrhizobium brasilense]